MFPAQAGMSRLIADCESAGAAQYRFQLTYSASRGRHASRFDAGAERGPSTATRATTGQPPAFRKNGMPLRRSTSICFARVLRPVNVAISSSDKKVSLIVMSRSAEPN